METIQGIGSIVQPQPTTLTNISSVKQNQESPNKIEPQKSTTEVVANEKAKPEEIQEQISKSITLRRFQLVSNGVVEIPLEQHVDTKLQMETLSKGNLIDIIA